METPVWPMVRPDGLPILAMVTKRVYQRLGTSFKPSTNGSLVEEPDYQPSSNGNELEYLVADSDFFAPLKASTDVIVRGNAYSRQGARYVDTSVEIGPYRKAIRAWGRRRVEVDHLGRPCFSAPETFNSVPITWDNAFGGRDRFAERGLPSKRWGARDEAIERVVAYPRNPYGKGFLVGPDSARISGTEGPAVEDPYDPVTAANMVARSMDDWTGRPAAATYEVCDWFQFPRVGFWLGIDIGRDSRALGEATARNLTTEQLSRRKVGAPIDIRAYNCASPGLFGVRLSGGEAVRLINLHPREGRIECSLPAERPTFVLQPPGCPIYELPALLATVLLEPDHDRLTMTWAGSLQVAEPYASDACNIMRRTVKW
ncbi:MAG: DUF2169 domain-containing protein [Polyangiaceae bacterium]|nr:DUF2169 domain-containing protein [Polyangiaceae bacterium]